MDNTMKHEKYYMGIAKLASDNSYDRREKVGACIVTKHNITLSGWNGTPEGFDNECQNEHIEKVFVGGGRIDPFENVVKLVTKPEVIHAEMNAISKAAREGVALDGSVLFCTLSPCIECAKMIIQSGIKEVVFLKNYRDSGGIDLLKKANIIVRKYDDSDRIS